MVEWNDVRTTLRTAYEDSGIEQMLERHAADEKRHFEWLSADEVGWVPSACAQRTVRVSWSVFWAPVQSVTVRLAR